MDRGRYRYRPGLYQDKSGFLTIQSSAIGTLYDDGTTLSTTVGYTLGDSRQIPASQGKIDVFVLQTALAAQSTVAIASNSLSPATYSYPIDVPSPHDCGQYVFLVSALDQHVAEDKGHRQRWALQNNNREWGWTTVAFTQGDFYSLAGDWWNSMVQLRYKQFPGDADLPNYQNNPSLTQMRTSMEYRIVVNNVVRKALGTIFFGGHGDESGGYLVMAGAQFSKGRAHVQTYLCTQAWYNANPAASQQSCLILETIHPVTNTTLSNIALVVLTGCGQLQGDGQMTASPLAADFISHGATCVVDVGMADQVSNYAHDWLSGYSNDVIDVASSFLGMLRSGHRIGDSASYAARWVNEKYNQNLNVRNPGGVGVDDRVVEAISLGHSDDYYQIKR